MHDTYANRITVSLKSIDKSLKSIAESLKNLEKPIDEQTETMIVELLEKYMEEKK